MGTRERRSLAWAGQNARLAAKLTGWKIDIKPASAPVDEGEETVGGEDMIEA